MTGRDEHEIEIDQQLEQLREHAGSLIESCNFANSFEAYGRLRRAALAHGRAIQYIEAVFFQMDQAQYLLDFQTMRERAVELISLLENEERARRVQSNLDESAYEFVVGGMSACAYENLAEATGQLEGFGSDQMQACITDGVQVCRQTGKLACIGCFREYAVDVYSAADDLELARHHCHQILEHPGPWSDRGDRRWLAASKFAWLELLEGRGASAWSLAQQSVELAEADAVSIPRFAQFLSAATAVSVGDALDRPVEDLRERMQSLVPPPGECPEFERRRDLASANRAAVLGRYDEAISLLSKWDEELARRKALTHWFETRLRLIAAHRLTGNYDLAGRLAGPLEESAQNGGAWLVLRRLNRLMDDDFSDAPLALANDLDFQASAPPRKPMPPPDAPAPMTAAQRAADEEASPLREELEQLGEELQESLRSQQWPDVAADQWDRLLSYSHQQTTHPDDAGRLIHFASFPPCGDRHVEIWNWANALAAPHREHARVLSVLAALGASLRRQLDDGPDADFITSERIQQLFRKSLLLDTTYANNYVRAGDFYLQEDEVGEAERCFARAFRLDRVSAAIAARLADLYKQTDRPRDALYVLDLSIREGCQEPHIALEAGLLSFTLGKYEAALTYLDRFEQQSEDEEHAWPQYYRSVSLYELGRFDEALKAIEIERNRFQLDGFHLAAVRSCIARAQNRIADADRDLRDVLGAPLREIDYLSARGVQETLLRVRRSLTHADSRDLLGELDSLLLAAGFAPQEYFEEQRLEGEAESKLMYHRCLVRQPLDEHWGAWKGCLHGQADWVHYFAEWDVLARDQQHATDLVLQAQASCYPFLFPELLAIESGEGEFHVAPGVVWQGDRFGGVEDGDDADDTDEGPDEDPDEGDDDDLEDTSAP